MKKGITLFLTLFLLLSFIYGAVADNAVRNVQKIRSLPGIVNKSQTVTTPVVVKANKTSPVPSALRQHLIQRVQQQSVKLLTKADFTGTFKSAPINKTSEAFDTLKLVFGEMHGITYTAGATFVLQVYTDEMLKIELYVDDGDGVFNPATDRAIIMPDGPDQLWLEDGKEPDETPAGDGLIQFHIDTGMIDEGPGAFFALQNVKIWVKAIKAVSQTEALGLLNILPISENTSISGSVTYLDETTTPRPAPNQIVFAFPGPIPIKNNDEPQAIFVTMTNANGQYLLGIPDAMRGRYVVGTVDFWNDFPGLFPRPPIQEVDAFGHVSNVNFVLQASNEKIVGYVRTNAGVPVSGITVHAEMDMYSVQGVTDANGYYEIKVLPGYWWVFIRPEELNKQFMVSSPNDNIEVPPNGIVTVDFNLYPCDGYFSGNVRMANGTPVGDLEVMAEISVPIFSDNWQWFWTSTRTNESGDYYLPVSKALQGVSVGHDTAGYRSSYSVWTWIEDGIPVPGCYNDMFADASGLDFRIYPTDVVLNGHIYNRDNSAPIYNASIHVRTLTPIGGDNGYYWDNWTSTDEQGYYEVNLIGGSPIGIKWLVEVYWPDNYYWPAVTDTLIAISGNTYTRDYFISQPIVKGDVQGYVRGPNGYGIAGAEVKFEGPGFYQTWTDSSGHYFITNMEIGNYNAFASAPGYTPVQLWGIWVGQGMNWYDFWLGAPSYKVSGIVRDATTNKPLKGALVFGWRPDSYDYYVMMTDTNGYYELFVNQGHYTFEAGQNLYYTQYYDSIWVDGDRILDYSLNPATISGNISGNVVDANYNPIGEVFVFMDSYNYMAYTMTDRNGHYEIPLADGDYKAVFNKEGYRNEFRQFTFPGGGIEDPLMMFSSDFIWGPRLVDVVDVPMDQGKQVRLSWKPDPNIAGSVKEYQIWRAIQPLNGPQPDPNMRLDWDFVAVVPRHEGFDTYNYVAPTLYDKVGDNIYWTGFMVTAVGWDGWSFWDSNVRAGWSEDNLPPEIPKNLNGTKLPGQIALQWDEVTNEEVKYYTIYRKIGTAEFTRLAYTTKPEYIDNDVAAVGAYSYSVSATDFGLNESEKSEPLNFTILSTEKGEVVPTTFSLAQNFPNPFNPSTRIEFGLPHSSDVMLTIFNLMGQVVREYRLQLPAGYSYVIWDGRDQYGNAVGSGVYIYTMATKEFKQTRKMILMR